MHNFVTDIRTKELAYLEMVATIVHQLTKDLSMDEIANSGFATYYVDHTVSIWPQAASETESPHHLRQYSASDKDFYCSKLQTA